MNVNSFQESRTQVKYGAVLGTFGVGAIDGANGMRQQNSVDNGLIFAYDIARHLRASRKPGLGHLPGCLLTIAVLLLLQGVMCPAGYAGNFPGKGSRQAWFKANKVYNEGTVLIRQRKFSEAVSRLKDAIAVYPYDADYYYNLGFAYEKSGELRLAEAAYRAALHLKPAGDWELWDGLKNVLYKQGRFRESRDACLKAMQNNPPVAEQPMLKRALSKLSIKLQRSESLGGATP